MVRKLDPVKLQVHSECVPVIYPDTFNLSEKRCGGEGEAECEHWDINSLCGPGGRCVCRKNMQWNTR